MQLLLQILRVFLQRFQEYAKHPKESQINSNCILLLPSYLLHLEGIVTADRKLCSRAYRGQQAVCI